MFVAQVNQESTDMALSDVYPSPDTCEYCEGREVVVSLKGGSTYLADIEYLSECNVCGSTCTHTWGKDTAVESWAPLSATDDKEVK
jgi:hypothetical protein